MLSWLFLASQSQVEVSVLQELDRRPQSWLLKLVIDNPRPHAEHRHASTDARLLHKLGSDCLFEQDSAGHINSVYFPHNETDDVIIFKKGEMKRQLAHTLPAVSLFLFEYPCTESSMTDIDTVF